MPAKFLEDDMDVVFSSKDFGVEGGCTWNGVVIADVIFDDMDVEVVIGEGVAEIVKQPMLTGKTSDFPSIRMDDTILVGTETFTVKNFVRDGTGMIEIYLNRTAS